MYKERAPSRQSSSIFNKLKSTVKQFDAYGEPITLTYKQDHTYKTFSGGVLSLLSRISILLYFLIQVPQVLQRNKIVSSKKNYLDLTNDNDPYLIGLDDFDLAIRLVRFNGVVSEEMIANRTRYFKYELQVREARFATVDNQTILRSNSTPIEMIPCTRDRLKNLLPNSSDQNLALNGWMCPRNLNVSLFGSRQTLQRQSLRLRVIPCNYVTNSWVAYEGLQCASDEEIQDAIDNHYFQVATYKQYFDENDYSENPIKSQVTFDSYNVASGQSYFKMNLVERVSVDTMDSWFSSQFCTNQYKFYRIDDTRVQPLVGMIKPGFDMLTLIFLKSDMEQEITRQVTSLTDIISKGGGMASFIIAMTYYIAHKFQRSLFERSLVKNVFSQIDDTQQINSRLKDAMVMNQENDTQRELNQDQRIRRVLDNLLYRKRLDIDFLKLRFRIIFGNCICSQRSKIQQKISQKQLEGYTIALNDKLDVIKIMNNFQKLKVLLYLFLSKSQRQLFPYLSFNLLNNSKIQRILNKKAFEKNHSSNPFKLNDVKKLLLEQNIQRLITNSKNKKKDKLLLKLIMDEWKVSKDPLMNSTINQSLKQKNNHTMIDSSLFPFKDDSNKKDKPINKLNMTNYLKQKDSLPISQREYNSD